MFTGIIEDIGVVKNISSSQIRIETKLGEIVRGESISVNGICFTVTSVDGSCFVADYSPSTGSVTTLSKLKQNSKVNLERAIKLSSRFGGHIVNGHIDSVTKIEEIKKLKEFHRIAFTCNRNVSLYCVDKGSVAVDGISLTISDLSSLRFEVFVIPETFNNTTIQFWKVCDEVNVEVDILARYVKKFLSKETTNVSYEMLEKNGFI